MVNAADALRPPCGGEGSTHTGLFVSLLVRYPDLGAVKYQPQTRCLVMRFILQPVPSSQAFQAFRTRVQQSLAAYADLTGSPIHVLNLTRSVHEPYCVVEVTRDVDTLTQEELTLLVSLVRDTFGDQLILDAPLEPLAEEDLHVQDELIGHMLEDVRLVPPLRDLIGFRENGRVLLFNRGDRDSHATRREG